MSALHFVLTDHASQESWNLKALSDAELAQQIQKIETDPHCNALTARLARLRREKMLRRYVPARVDGRAH